MRALCLCLVAALTIHAKQVDITLLATTDLHGNIYPYDYLTGANVNRGLAKMATLIKQERKAAPNALLIDCGDTIQGAPLESVYQTFVRTGKFPGNLKPSVALKADPMMLVMNRVGYDAMVVGNHEFNFGLDAMQKAREAARFPWISANARATAASGRKPFAPYFLKTVEGVKVAVIGITTPAVPSWEKPENFRDYQFIDAKDAVIKALAEVQQHKPDLVIVAAHMGLERDPKTGAIRQGDARRENSLYQIAHDVKGIDAIVFGHTHQELPEYRIGDVLLMQPKNWGSSLGRMKLTLESRPEGGFKVISKSSSLIPATAATEADADILRVSKPYHDITEAYLNSKVAEAPAELLAGESRIKDTAIIDAIHAVQMHYGKADVSFSASFNPRAIIPKGPVTVRQIASLYIYDNELYTIQGNGKMVKDALENAARYYNQCPDTSCRGPLLNRSVIPYNYDMAQGVTYELDLTKPVGQRVQNLRFNAQPLRDDQPLRIALNNYRAGGSGGYTAFRGAPLLWRSYEDMRELIIRYYSEHPLPAKPDNNWRVVPESASKQLETEARAEGTRQETQ
ncbi:MAG TPA: 5'-nucleotidase C-terminal domain-containing protein [Bryobacteraceae bacterium]|nr:5'-nucleotidase C-terminal domain-containing protein [Bryobacteraceae bacterium]